VQVVRFGGASNNARFQLAIEAELDCIGAKGVQGIYQVA
jgi:hypothetical protein